MASESDPAVLRIGELARRVAVNQDLLRAWERRYGLLKPVRSPSGFRLYSGADEQRVRRMQAHLGRGLAAAEAARAALDEESNHSLAAPPVAPAAAGNPTREDALAPPDAPFPGTDQGLTGLAEELRHALDELDGPAAEAVLDRLFADFTVETTLREVLVPYLRPRRSLGQGRHRRDHRALREQPAPCPAGQPCPRLGARTWAMRRARLPAR